MPLYGAPQSGGLTMLSPGEATTLFAAADTITAPQASIAFCRGASPVADDAGTTFQIEFASSPTDSLEILGSNKAPAASFVVEDWVVLATSSDKESDLYTDTGRWAYYCAYLVTQSGGGACTVLAQR